MPHLQVARVAFQASSKAPLLHPLVVECLWAVALFDELVQQGLAEELVFVTTHPLHLGCLEALIAAYDAN